MYVGVAVVVYFIWQGRNNSYWQHSVPSIRSSIKQIRTIVRARIGGVMPEKVSRKDHEWFMKL